MRSAKFEGIEINYINCSPKLGELSVGLRGLYKRTMNNRQQSSEIDPSGL